MADSKDLTIHGFVGNGAWMHTYPEGTKPIHAFTVLLDGNESSLYKPVRCTVIIHKPDAELIRTWSRPAVYPRYTDEDRAQILADWGKDG